MLADEGVRRELFARLRAPDEMTLLAIVAVAFLILHFLTGVILLRTSPNEVTVPREEAIASSCD